MPFLPAHPEDVVQPQVAVDGVREVLVERRSRCDELRQNTDLVFEPADEVQLDERRRCFPDAAKILREPLVKRRHVVRACGDLLRRLQSCDEALVRVQPLEHGDQLTRDLATRRRRGSRKMGRQDAGGGSQVDPRQNGRRVIAIEERRELHPATKRGLVLVG